MSFKSRNQMLMEQHYEDQSVVEQMKTVLYELIAEGDMDIDDVRACFEDTFDGYDTDTIEGAWDEVMATMSELN